MSTALEVVNPKLEEAFAKMELSVEGATSLRNAFAPHFTKFEEIVGRIKAVDIVTPKQAREFRLALKAERVACDKTRKAQKEDSLRRGKAIDGVYSVYEYQVTPVEEAMEAVEKAAEIAEANRKQALAESRRAELTPYRDTQFYDLGSMPEAAWAQLLADAKLSHETAQAVAAKVEQDRIAAEKAAAEAKAKREAEEAAERERMKAENERLAKVAAEERAQREEAEKKAKAEREAAEKKAQEERKAAERKAAAERAEQQKAIDAERKKREEAEAALKAKADAEAKRVAAEKAAQKKAAAAPDKRKLEIFASLLRNLETPAMATPDGKDALIGILPRITALATFIETEAGKL